MYTYNRSIKLNVTQIFRSVCVFDNYKYLDIYKIIYKLFVFLFIHTIFTTLIVYILVKKVNIKKDINKSYF